MWLADRLHKCGIGRKSYHRLFVDEAGDTTLRDPALPRIDGVSRFFMLGAVYLPRPEKAHRLMSALRERLKADSYFSTIPTMKSTAVAFHACKDADDVKREVFRMLPGLGATVHIAIRRKSAMYRESQELKAKSGGRLTPNMMYDDLVGPTLAGMIPRLRNTRVLFARRTNSDRIDALHKAIDEGLRWKLGTEDPSFMNRMSVETAQPHEAAGLQVVDYYLWAVQRLFEQTQPRFFNAVAGAYRMIVDLDDKRNNPGGEIYDARNPLTLEKIKPVAG